jgi:uncharacterized protein (DUF2342 family)
MGLFKPVEPKVAKAFKPFAVKLTLEVEGHVKHVADALISKADELDRFIKSGVDAEGKVIEAAGIAELKVISKDLSDLAAHLTKKAGL